MHAQTDSLVKQVDIAHVSFTTDVYYNVYCITPQNEIVRIHPFTGLRLTYSNTWLGKPDLVDAGNPLKTLVFYKNLQTLVILDKMMSEISVVRWNSQQGVAYRPSLLCRASAGDHIWMFDELSQRLMRIDESGNIIAAGDPWYQLYENPAIPEKMFSAGDQVYVYTSDGVLRSFDTFANPGKIYIMPVPQDMFNSSVLFEENGNIMQFDLISGQSIVLRTAENNTMYTLRPPYLFAGQGSFIRLYALTD